MFGTLMDLHSVPILSRERGIISGRFSIDQTAHYTALSLPPPARTRLWIPPSISLPLPTPSPTPAARTRADDESLHLSSAVAARAREHGVKSVSRRRRPPQRRTARRSCPPQAPDLRPACALRPPPIAPRPRPSTLRAAAAARNDIPHPLCPKSRSARPSTSAPSGVYRHVSRETRRRRGRTLRRSARDPAVKQEPSRPAASRELESRSAAVPRARARPVSSARRASRTSGRRRVRSACVAPSCKPTPALTALRARVVFWEQAVYANSGVASARAGDCAASDLMCAATERGVPNLYMTRGQGTSPVAAARLGSDFVPTIRTPHSAFRSPLPRHPRRGIAHVSFAEPSLAIAAQTPTLARLGSPRPSHSRLRHPRTPNIPTPTAVSLLNRTLPALSHAGRETSARSKQLFRTPAKTHLSYPAAKSDAQRERRRRILRRRHLLHAACLPTQVHAVAAARAPVPRMQSRPRTSQIGAYARLAGGRAGIGAASAYIPRVVYDHGAHAEAEEAQCENEGVPPLPRSLFRPATSKSSAGCAASLHSPSCLRGTQFWDVEPDPHAGCAGGDEEQGRAIDASDPEVGRGNGSWDTYDAGDVAAAHQHPLAASALASAHARPIPAVLERRRSPALPRCASPGSAEPRATVLDPQVLAAAAHFCPRRAPAPPLPHTATTSPLRESRAQRAKSDAITAVASPRIERIERACRKALVTRRCAAAARAPCCARSAVCKSPVPAPPRAPQNRRQRGAPGQPRARVPPARVDQPVVRVQAREHANDGGWALRDSQRPSVAQEQGCDERDPHAEKQAGGPLSLAYYS
ncbi:hypothetical protein B0H15DRAFT_932781 [Mycena belliarum]|uniref:Uncharacterized protein n=1 Tax=Mycena belliarum TaxID=1033014 RepID=A0AAD6TYK5_9AGAR|nr:hypothetical protein B0H15DRAFT_932781 [Mycena belliae]